MDNDTRIPAATDNILPIGPMPEILAVTNELAELRQKVATQAALVTSAEENMSYLRELYRDALEAHQSDIAIIGEELLEQANDRGWCSEFDDFVRDANRRLKINLPMRKRTIRVAVDFTVYVDVEATDDDDALEQADEIFDKVEREIDAVSGTTQQCYRSTMEIDE